MLAVIDHQLLPHQSYVSMTLKDAIDLILPGIKEPSGTWADIGAGTGMFTRALLEILSKESMGDQVAIKKGGNRGSWGNPPSHGFGGRSRSNKIYAVDKSPHALWALKSTADVEIIVVEADFNEPIKLPLMDGIVMANALHYARNHFIALQNVLRCLKSEGTFILVEYETETSRPPWVPNPVSFKRFEALCVQARLEPPEIIGTHESHYGDEHIYAGVARKI